MDDFSTKFNISLTSKISTELMLALTTPLKVRENSIDLNIGFDESMDSWSLIVRYQGDINELSKQIGFQYVALLNQFAVVKINTNKILDLIQAKEILYLEKPKKIYEEILLNRKDVQTSCFPYPNFSIGTNDIEENNKENYVLVAMIDSGIDIYHPQFINENGESKIECLWNQRWNISSMDALDSSISVPDVYGFGVEFHQKTINKLIQDKNPNLDSYRFDPSGHGTAVASIICDLIPNVKLLVISIINDTLALMCAIDYAIRYANARNLPLVLNLSYGNNYGDHAGNSILESYLDSVSLNGKFTFVTGMGNDGNTGRHTEINLNSKEIKQIEILVQPGVKAFNIQVWSEDVEYIIRLIPPSFDSSRNHIDYQNGTPTPYNILKENFISISSNNQNEFVQSGIWSLILENKSNQFLQIEAWLPVAASTSADVMFVEPSVMSTFTIPASSNQIISVGALDSVNQLVPAFSGRGYTLNKQVKPDVVAPGVDVNVAKVGGGTTSVSGTSFAVPFVSSAAYYLMNKGIIQGENPFLFGQKLKSVLRNTAREVPGYKQYPNYITGFGALCLEESLKRI